MHTASTHHDTRRDSGRWTSVPGYLDDVGGVRERRAHRANLRGRGLAEERLVRAEPSPHQLASLIAHAVGVALVVEPHGEFAKLITKSLKTASEAEGWLLDDRLRERLATRIRLDAEEIEYIQAEVAGEVTRAEHRSRVTTLRRRRIERSLYDLARRRGEAHAMAMREVLDEEG